MRWLTALALVVFGTSCALAQEGSTVNGKVTFEGDPPKRSKIKMEAEPTCEAKHGEEGALKEDVVVNADKTLKNVVVYVTKISGKFAVPTTEVEITQEGCIYHPHVSAIMVGQKVHFKNGDPLTHNVHGMPKMNNEFNFGQNQQGQVNPVELATAEAAIKVKCDVHPWMMCWVHVFEHPFFAVTGDDGSYSIKGLPAGEYELKAWHEKSKTGWTQKVTVDGKETKEANWTVKAEELK